VKIQFENNFGCLDYTAISMKFIFRQKEYKESISSDCFFLFCCCNEAGAGGRQHCWLAYSTNQSLFNSRWL